MDLSTAALIVATRLMDRTSTWEYDAWTMGDVVAGIVRTTTDFQSIETLIKIARWESGGFRKDVGTCKVKGDHGAALGIFQVHPFNDQEREDLCSPDYAKQAAVALFHVNDSIATCTKFGMKGHDLLSVYTHGRCHSFQDNVARIHWGNGDELRSLMWTEEHPPVTKPAKAEKRSERR